MAKLSSYSIMGVRAFLVMLGSLTPDYSISWYGVQYRRKMSCALQHFQFRSSIAPPQREEQRFDFSGRVVVN
jgi:hypothetical protein